MLAELVISGFRYVSKNPLETQLVVILGFLIYYLIVYPFYLSPLRKIPGPYFHRISYFQALNSQRNSCWIQKVHKLHLKHGNVVVLSPNEISVNGKYKFINDLYVKNMPKSKFYENFRNHGFKDNIFASLENDRHLRYKKIVMSLYSKSSIFSKKNNTRDIIVEKVGQLVNAVATSSVTGEEPDHINARSIENEHGKGHKLRDGTWFNSQGKTRNLGIDVYSLFAALAMDVVSSFELGKENGTDLLLHPEKRHIIVSHRTVASMVFWTTLMPRFWDMAASTKVKKASGDILDWQLKLYAKAEQNVPKFRDDENLTTLEALKRAGLDGEYAYSFLTDNIFAGHETTAIQLTYLCYELSRPSNFGIQVALRRELENAFGKPNSTTDVINDLETVDSLPYLNAILDENSRVHTSIPGAEPRVVDKPYTVELGSGEEISLPKGTVISCLPFSVHRQEDVFPSPNQFIPERWLQYEQESTEDFKARIKTQNKFMMPFGKGIRMCLGMNVALIEMKLAIANLYWHYNSKICADWCDVTEYPSDKVPKEILLGEDSKGSNRTDEEKMVMVDNYTIRPLNDECWLEWYRNT
ncbi:cytochrome P450 [Scheffersomyces xylosifermentans]|uniref:cytochrome P450 n=1 Tax=Scheffersomyces xylosifermentans TaxID=1304137 RepID=UPI00315D6964